MNARGAGHRLELRQLQYFVTLAEELHFGRAAAREHIVQSALSQQIQRLEHTLDVTLLERNTHHVRLTPAGEALRTEATRVLRTVDSAVIATQQASADTEVLRVAVGDASLDSMPQVLRTVQCNWPDLVVHRVEAAVPTQYRMLAEASMDLGIGRAAYAPAGIATELIRRDPMGVLLSTDHPLASGERIALREMDGIPLVMAEDAIRPEFNDFVLEVCRAAGFRPIRHRGSAQSVRAAAYLVAQQACVALVPSSCDLMMPGLRWLPLDPPCHYPWSLLWRAGDDRWSVEAVRSGARALAEKLGWLSGSTVPEIGDRQH